MYRGFALYRKTKKEQTSKVKGYFTVLKDLNYLSSKFKCFPDTYFRFGMFMKDYTDRGKMSSFIPQIAYSRKVSGNNRYSILIDDKIIFHDLMSYYGLPVPERYFVYRDGEFRKGDEILSDEETDAILRSVTDNRIFVKRFTGGAASGISILTKDESGTLRNTEGEVVSASLLRKSFGKEGYILEKQLIQEQDLSKFNPDTVNTIRVTTFNNAIVGAAIRFGAKGAFVDNTAKGGVAVTLDIENGQIGDYGLREYDLTHYLVHPDSLIAFKGEKCTQWPQVKSLVEKCMRYFPYYKSVGYDVATTPDGPVIIEINTGAGIYLAQMGKDTGLADKFMG